MTSPAAPDPAPDPSARLRARPFGEGGVDERQGAGEDQRSAETLDRARRELHLGPVASPPASDATA